LKEFKEKLYIVEPKATYHIHITW